MPSAATPPRPGAFRRPARTADREEKILFQKFFKSKGPRTYVAQVKEARNGNHYLVLTEGKRDAETGDVRKIRLFLYSEDFVEFFRMLHETAQFIRSNPVPESVKLRQQRYWAKQSTGESPAASPAPRRRPSRKPAGRPRDRNG